MIRSRVAGVLLAVEIGTAIGEGDDRDLENERDLGVRRIEALITRLQKTVQETSPAISSRGPSEREIIGDVGAREAVREEIQMHPIKRVFKVIRDLTAVVRVVLREMYVKIEVVGNRVEEGGPGKMDGPPEGASADRRRDLPTKNRFQIPAVTKI